ncbi:NAD(P)-dependent oxidoreductase [Labedaea rhizosphaerae]|uniref:3-hydroxyisobutyrate dehydrogenase n=1 Tax=Labedaea rhizosphaerae TaxID=598644 RepID=A0A4R6SFE6_LABRH|nr:NAD(P)-dependent oxidoreductase [Labedaea rhizosphaerae]TDQ00423.1 3-hydroxyisobutyrate dehydrogenase [Labedaea rhizosphaerae]
MSTDETQVTALLPRDSRIALVGAGRMGLPISRTLVGAGFEVVVTDLRAEVAEAVAETGARWSAEASEAADGADIVITVMPGTPELQDLMAGSAPLLDALAVGTTWIDMTSASPLIMKPIQDAARARGVAVLEAPMGGGPAAAAAGTLRLFVGGEPATFRRVRPVLEAIADSEHIKLVGGPGLGYTAKLLVNLLWFGQAVATAEAMLLGQAAGLDVEALRALLADSAAGSEFLRHDLPRVLAGDYLPLFGLDRCTEELEAVTELFRTFAVPSDLSRVVTRVHQRALARFGPVDGELMAVALLEELTGTRLRSGSRKVV